MIKFNDVGFSYGKKDVLRDFSLEINKGDRACLSGESGIGKTTVLRLILGLEKPKKGEILIDKALKPAVVFQEDRLLPFKTVLENITLFGADEQGALGMLKKLGLENYADKYPAELSGGMSRRVAIARALTASFDYLLLDEPFTGLDKANTENCVEIINEVLGERPLILVTHSKTEAEALNCSFKEIL